MNKITIEVTIIDQYPFFKLIVKGPGNAVKADTAQYHIAASQFEPRVKQAFAEAIEQLCKPYKEKK